MRNKSSYDWEAYIVKIVHSASFMSQSVEEMTLIISLVSDWNLATINLSILTKFCFDLGSFDARMMEETKLV